MRLLDSETGDGKKGAAKCGRRCHNDWVTGGGKKGSGYWSPGKVLERGRKRCFLEERRNMPSSDQNDVRRQERHARGHCGPMKALAKCAQKISEEEYENDWRRTAMARQATFPLRNKDRNHRKNKK